MTASFYLACGIQQSKGVNPAVLCVSLFVTNQLHRLPRPFSADFVWLPCSEGGLLCALQKIMGTLVTVLSPH